MKLAPLTVLLAGALILAGCPDAKDAKDSTPPLKPQPMEVPAPTTKPAPAGTTTEPVDPKPIKTNEVASLPQVTYYALSG